MLHREVAATVSASRSPELRPVFAAPAWHRPHTLRSKEEMRRGVSNADWGTNCGMHRSKCAPDAGHGVIRLGVFGLLEHGAAKQRCMPPRDPPINRNARHRDQRSNRRQRPKNNSRCTLVTWLPAKKSPSHAPSLHDAVPVRMLNTPPTPSRPQPTPPRRLRPRQSAPGSHR